MLNTHVEKPHLITPEEKPSDLDDLLRYLFSQKKLIVLAALLTCLFAISYTYFTPTEYKASVILAFHPQNEENVEPISSQIALIKSDFILQPVIQNLSKNQNIAIEKALEKLRSKLTITDLTGLASNFPNKPGLLQLTLTQQNAEQAVQWINQVAYMTEEKDIERKALDARIRLKYLKQQLPVIQKSLLQSQITLNQFLASHGKMDTRLQQKILNENLLETNKQIQSSQIKLAELSQQYTSYYPDIKMLKNKIKMLQTKRLSLASQMNALTSVNQLETQFIDDIRVKTTIYSDLLNKIHNDEMAQAGMSSDVSVLAPATFAEKAHPLKFSLIILASLFVGTFFGMLLALGKRIVRQ